MNERFAHNKYSKWYYYIIDHAKCQGRIKGEQYYESHHIVPSCMGGTETVFLTAREHYICHLLLTKMCINEEDRSKMLYALNMMNGMTDKHQRYRAKSVLYEYARREHALNVSKTHTGRIVSDETRKKLSAWQKGKPKSEKHLAALSKAVNKRNSGNKHSEETILKMKNRPRRIVVCPKCNKTGENSAMHRWHFENCKR